MKKLLLHVCCAPCALMPHKYLSEEFDTTLFFYNPNIHPKEEFEKRRDCFLEFVEKENIKYISVNEYTPFEKWVKDKPTLEFPKRCFTCYTPRLEESAKQAKELGFDYFSTSLLYSRYQQHDMIISQGHAFAKDYEIQFIDRDFRPYWYDGINLSKEKNFYRQKYCGCGLPENGSEKTSKNKKKENICLAKKD